MWTTELLLCFEMQLIRLNLTSEDPIIYRKKNLYWKIFRFFVLLMSISSNLLQIWVNNETDIVDLLQQDDL
jgi:hypothetical protein